jgi:hypothetical protein
MNACHDAPRAQREERQRQFSRHGGSERRPLAGGQGEDAGDRGEWEDECKQTWQCLIQQHYRIIIMQRESDVCGSVGEACVLMHGGRRCRACHLCVCAQAGGQGGDAGERGEWEDECKQTQQSFIQQHRMQRERRL